MEHTRMMLASEADLDAEQARLAESYRRDGEIINVVRLFARFTEFFRAYKPFGLYTMVRSSLPPRIRELAILRLAVINKSDYEWAHHSRIALSCDISIEEVERIRVGDDRGWGEDDLAILQCVDAVRSDASITDELYARLSRFMDERAIFDLVITIGNYNMVSAALNVARVPLEDGLVGFREPVQH